MKGAGNPPSDSRPNIVTTSSSEEEQHISEEEEELLQNLGFEEGELEMLFSSFNIGVEELIERYLEVIQSQPYNWSSLEEAMHSGTPESRRRAVEDTLNSYYHPDEYVSFGGRIRNKSYKKTRTKKTRTKKKHTKKTHTKKTHTKKTRTKRRRHRK